MTETEPLLHDHALEWAKWNLPHGPEFFKDLMPAICHAFQKPEADLHLLVREKFLDKEDFTWDTVSRWVECSN